MIEENAEQEIAGRRRWVAAMATDVLKDSIGRLTNIMLDPSPDESAEQACEIRAIYIHELDARIGVPCGECEQCIWSEVYPVGCMNRQPGDLPEVSPEMIEVRGMTEVELEAKALEIRQQAKIAGRNPYTNGDEVTPLGKWHYAVHAEAAMRGCQASDETLLNEMWQAWHSLYEPCPSDCSSEQTLWFNGHELVMRAYLRWSLETHSKWCRNYKCAGCRDL